MAFVFVPNADGNFDEGMRQTNPDTGVEYIFTDGAWRPLGPKIEDQFDELDQRYLPLSGGTLTDLLYFDRGTEGVNMLIHPNANDTSSSIYALNSGAIRFRTSRTENLITGSNTHIVIGRTDTLDPQTNIYHLAYPQDGHWAANKTYVDEQVGNIQLDGDYLPLTGGTLTGDLDIENKHLYVSRGDDINFIIEPSGFCRTKDLFRADRNESGPCFQSRLNGETNFEVRSEGTVNCAGDITLRDQKRIKVRGTSNTDVGYFMATSDSQCQLGAYSGKLLNIKNLNAPSAATDAASKGYVDSAVAFDITKSGSQELEASKWSIRQKDANENLKTFISVEDGTMNLYHVPLPESGTHAANKQYVDEAVSNSSGGAAGFTLNLWTYKGSKSSSSGLNDGEFGSRMLSGNVLELYLAGRNSQGKIYHPTNTNNAIFEYSHQITNSGQAGSPLTVMAKDGRCMWYAETKKIVFNKGGNSGVMIEAVQFRAGVNLLTDGQQYMLNVPGFLSSVLGW